MTAARIFFDYDRIKMFDEEHSQEENRYYTIGDTSTERETVSEEGAAVEVTRLISARMAMNFERGLYYGKYS